jgi:TonB family protein
VAKENGNSIPPKLVTMAPITVAAEINEKYAGQVLRVTLRISLSDGGAVQEEMKIIEGSGEDLIDQAVISAVKNSTFLPAYRDGKAISSSIILPLQVEVKNDVPQEEAAVNEGQPATQQ